MNGKEIEEYLRISSNASSWIAFGLLGLAGLAPAQTDPGVREDATGTGAPIAGLTVKERKFFAPGQDQFSEIQSVTGSLPNTEPGLGPRFNLNSCAGCHAFPAIGGSSPRTNPQISVAPSSQVNPLIILNIIGNNGPIREVRFKSDGGVHDLFTIAGRSDTPPGCVISQPDFATHVGSGDVSFRIPTPVFGAGLIEAISDSTIAANVALGKPFGIAGHANRNGNDGTITRFGWKAQNKSLAIFAGEAYNVEQGITNELFPDDRGEGGVQDSLACRVVAAAQDHTHYEPSPPQKVPSDTIAFANFMRLLAPTAAVTSYGNVTAASINNGRTQFGIVGCAVCHMPSMPTGTTIPPPLRMYKPTSSRTCWFTTWACLVTGSHKALRVRTTSVPRRSGGWVKEYFSCTTEEPAT